ncbi:hypothetical protein AB0912_15550 [Streptomyces sp. NPDC007084]|uniref:hypothetical protein n=1 Tax=Streptomyces sp. NPDC007084 TaxID=3154313 RepID=UPI003454EDDF
MTGRTPEEAWADWDAQQERKQDVPPTEPAPPAEPQNPALPATPSNPPKPTVPPTVPPRPLPTVLKRPAETKARESWIIRLLHPEKADEAAAEREPECSHPRAVPVNNIYGETIAQLCLVCDEQLDPPASEEADEQPAPPAEAGAKKKPKAPGRGTQLRRPVSLGGGASKIKAPDGATVKKGRRSRIKPALFTGSAAAVGYGFGLVQLLGVYLPVAEQAAVGTVSLLLAVAGGWGAWRLFGRPEIGRIFPVPSLARVLATLGAGELCRRMAPAPVDWLNDHGQQWGLGASAVSLLLTAGGMCVGLWWLIDSRVRHKPLLFRWLARIPLASALLATALYAPGNTR